MPLVTFDFHNTIAHCDTWFALEIRDLPAGVLHLMREDASIEVSDELAALAADTYRQIRRNVTLSGIEIDAHTAVMTTFADIGVIAEPRTVERYIRKIMRAALSDLQPVDGVLELIHELHNAGFPLGIISSAVYHPFLEWSLKEFGVSDCFDFVVTSASAGFYKSNPQIYLHALELAGMAPQRALHIGDSPRWDVTTANAVGMTTVLLNPHCCGASQIDEGLTAPDLEVDSFVDSRDAIVALAKSLPADLPAMPPMPPMPATEEPAVPVLRVDIFTLFPTMFAGPFDESILKRALAQGIVDVRIHDIRDWTKDKHHTADDTPYGGGAGMVMKAPPIVEAIEDVLGEQLERAHIAITSAGGRKFSQKIAHELATCERLVLICGHYEGIDERVSALLDADELSIGDYVMTGGELPAMVIVDTIARLIPHVITAESIADESHAESRAAIVEYPHYTRPATYRGHGVPSVLMSGHHARIDEWRQGEARKRTSRWRPDLMEQGSGT